MFFSNLTNQNNESEKDIKNTIVVFPLPKRSSTVFKKDESVGHHYLTERKKEYRALKTNDIFELDSDTYKPIRIIDAEAIKKGNLKISDYEVQNGSSQEKPSQEINKEDLVKNINYNAKENRREVLSNKIDLFEGIITSYIGEYDDLVLKLQDELLNTIKQYGYDIVGEMVQELIILSTEYPSRLVTISESLVIFSPGDLHSYSYTILNILLSHKNRDVIQAGFELFEQWETVEIIKFMQGQKYAEQWMQDYVSQLEL